MMLMRLLQVLFRDTAGAQRQKNKLLLTLQQIALTSIVTMHKQESEHRVPTGMWTARVIDCSFCSKHCCCCNCRCRYRCRCTWCCCYRHRCRCCCCCCCFAAAVVHIIIVITAVVAVADVNHGHTDHFDGENDDTAQAHAAKGRNYDADADMVVMIKSSPLFRPSALSYVPEQAREEARPGAR